jgi:hypothetical protein
MDEVPRAFISKIMFCLFPLIYVYVWCEVEKKVNEKSLD